MRSGISANWNEFMTKYKPPSSSILNGDSTQQLDPQTTTITDTQSQTICLNSWPCLQVPFSTRTPFSPSLHTCNLPYSLSYRTTFRPHPIITMGIPQIPKSLFLSYYPHVVLTLDLFISQPTQDCLVKTLSITPRKWQVRLSRRTTTTLCGASGIRVKVKTGCVCVRLTGCVRVFSEGEPREGEEC